MAQLAEHLSFLMDVAARKITKFYNQRLRRFGITYNHLSPSHACGSRMG
jgi:hypothetical protein